jgi:hypothetical protein
MLMVGKARGEAVRNRYYKSEWWGRSGIYSSRRRAVPGEAQLLLLYCRS